MALNSFNAYHSYLKSIEPLNDAERGRLFTALLEYSSTGATPDLRGNERFIFPTMKEQIDRDREKYEAKCAAQSINGKKGGRPKKPENPSLFWESQKSQKSQGQGKRQGQGQGQGQEQSPSGERAQGAKKKSDPVSWDTCVEEAKSRGFSPKVEASVLRWFDYKRERGESYVPTGLASLLTRIKNMEAEFGSDAVSDAILNSIERMWMGIVFDHLKKGGYRNDTSRNSSQSGQSRRAWGITYDT